MARSLSVAQMPKVASGEHGTCNHLWHCNGVAYLAELCGAMGRLLKVLEFMGWKEAVEISLHYLAV